MNDDKFKEEVFEIAFGDDAVYKDYTNEEVVNRLKEMNEAAVNYEEQNS